MTKRRKKYFACDFRRAAVNASERLLISSSFETTANPIDLDMSLCLCASTNGKKACQVAALLCLSGLAIAIIGAMISSLLFKKYDWVVVPGMLCICPLFWQKLNDLPVIHYCRSILMRRPGWDRLQHLPSFFATIEDPATLKEEKTVMEDYGLCFLDSENKRLIIEGLSHRYFIRGIDVISISIVSSQKLKAQSLAIHYRINRKRSLTIILKKFHGLKAAMSELSLGFYNPTRSFLRIIEATLLG